MDYVSLGRTGLKVSRLCLGMMTYGSPSWRDWVLPEARDQAARAAGLSRQRFNAGADSFLLVLDAERTQAAADADASPGSRLETMEPEPAEGDPTRNQQTCARSALVRSPY